MGWRIVCQPNGLYARFSDIVDHFTHWNMTNEEALELCQDHMSSAEAERKVKAARDELDRRGKPQKAGFRWGEALQTIENIHGHEERREAELSVTIPLEETT